MANTAVKTAPEQQEAPKPKRPHLLVKLAGKRYEWESDDVTVAINGVRFDFQRGKHVPMTADQVEALRNAEVPYYVTEEGSDRKVLGGMMPRYPFEVACRLSDEEYKQLKAVACKKDLSAEDLKPFLY